MAPPTMGLSSTLAILGAMILAVPRAAAFVAPAISSRPVAVITDSTAVDGVASRSVVSRDHTRECRRSTAVWGKKLPKEQREEREKQLKEEEDQIAEERRKAGKNVLLHTPNTEPDFWGVDRVMEIGEDKIAYTAVRGGTMPAILYLPAFDAPSNDQKAERIRMYCSKEDYPFISMEWYGVGKSTGDFSQGTISRWKQDAMTLIEKLLPDRSDQIVIVGGGVGGWIATLIGVEMPDKVAGIVGLAADPDFTENLLVRYLPESTLKEITEKGVATITWGRSTYPVSKALLDDGRQNLVLQGPVGGLQISCPVRLVHGLDDEEVPYTVSLDLSRRLGSTNVNLYLVKTANHHLDGFGILDLVIRSLTEVMELYVPPNIYYTDINIS